MEQCTFSEIFDRWTYRFNKLCLIFLCENCDWHLIHCQSQPYRWKVVFKPKLVTQDHDNITIVLRNRSFVLLHISWWYFQDCLHILFHDLSSILPKEGLHLCLLNCYLGFLLLIKIPYHIFYQLNQELCMFLYCLLLFNADRVHSYTLH